MSKVQYICDNGHVFNDPLCWKEPRPGDGADEEMCGCLECKEGFEESFDCAFCETAKPISEKSEILLDCCTTCEESILTELSDDETVENIIEQTTN